MSEKSGPISRLIRFALPPERWQLPVLILLGILTGLAMHLVYVSNAVSYLSDSPLTCINCHVMTPQYATWERGSHGRVATCNDCHVPHDNIFQTYLFKAQDGMRHASIFTLRLEEQVIRIKHAGKEAVQGNCIRCHLDQIQPIAMRPFGGSSVGGPTSRYCWDCHRETPHGRVNSLSSVPYARVPKPSKLIPSWLSEGR